MLLKLVEVRFPETAIRHEPRVEFGERTWCKPIQPPLGDLPHSDETGIPGYPQVLRCRRLTDVERIDDLRHGPLPSPQDIKDLAAPWFSNHLEDRFHLSSITMQLYACKRI